MNQDLGQAVEPAEDGKVESSGEGPFEGLGTWRLKKLEVAAAAAAWEATMAPPVCRNGGWPFGLIDRLMGEIDANFEF